MGKFKLTYNKIYSKAHISSRDLYFRFLDREYHESIGWGFSALSLSGTLISGAFLQKMKRYYQVWNAENERLDKIAYLIVKETLFFLDIEQSCIIVQGGISDLNSLKAAFRQILWGEFTYIDNESDVFLFLSELKKDNILIEIEEIFFSDVILQNKFVGKYIAIPTAQTNNLNSLKLINGKIDKTKVRISKDNYIFEVLISSNNTYMINGTDENVQTFVNYLISKTC